MATSPDLFDAYFRRADTDRDGRISGQEAVSFFQGANLNREVLAKIWQYVDQGQTGFLTRDQFYNALKLVTVAQTGRELTPPIVSRALNGPAASQIPPPQIQLPANLGPQVRPIVAQYQPQVVSTPLARAPNPPTTPTMSTSTSSLDWPTNKSSSWSGPSSVSGLADGHLPLQTKGVLPSQDAFRSSSSIDSTTLKSTNSTSLNSTVSAEPRDLFGGDVFTAIPVNKPSVSSSAQPISHSVLTTNETFQARGLQTTNQSDPSPTFSLVPTSSAPMETKKQIQPVLTPIDQTHKQDQNFGTPTTLLDGVRAWPKMTDATIRKYTKIFSEVDTDKDGKISGNQARDLFLSWRLPREILKQIWDLSDQDRDSMLSLREFCVSLYLMERHREGRALPAMMDPTPFFDESGIKALRISEAQVAFTQNSSGHNVPAWQQNPAMLQPTAPGLPPRPVARGVPLQRPPVMIQGQTQIQPPVGPPAREGFVQGLQKSNTPVLEMYKVNQLSADDQLTLQTKHQEAVDAEKKMHELEKQIMDSKEKMEFYRTKMQEIVLFKTRCDNRLAEITERASSDKREVESLVKRYDEKFKQAGEAQSRLLTDEAAFRDIQERRLELYNAILSMEQGGDTNAFLQARADRLQNDLDELKKALNAKCKHLSLKIKPTSLLELPYGWQPGIQENAAQWDEDWDKFEDEGFTYVQEFMEEKTAGSDAAKPKSPATWDENHGFDFSAGDGEMQEEEEDVISNENQGESSPRRDQNGSLSRNGDASPREDTPSSPEPLESGVFTSNKDSERFSPVSSQSESDTFGVNGGDWASAFTHPRGDDTGSNASWGRTESSNAKASEESFFSSAKIGTKSSTFGFNDPFDTSPNLGQSGKLQEDLPSFGPIRTKERTSVFFDNSVPSTPIHNNNNTLFNHYPSGGFFDESIPNTPVQNNVLRGSSQEQVLRFDSFSSTTTSDSFARFDSFTSSVGGTQPRSFASLDEPDPFLGTRSSQAPRHSTDSWNAF